VTAASGRAGELRFGVLLRVAYDGRGFHGFAPQPNQRTIAGELLGALRTIDPTIAEVRGASRTDAGVHARDQRVAFDAVKEFPVTAWTGGAQRQLPEAISIRAAAPVAEGFSPRANAIAKTYRYTLLADEQRDPFLDGRSWRVPEACEPDGMLRMLDEARALVGTRDFAAFRGAADQRENTVRTLHAVAVERSAEDARLVRIDVRGDGFLYNMVRIIVGTLVDVGRGRLSPGAVTRALASHDRRDGGITAPPDGLTLQQFEMAGDDERGWTGSS
jgi:tRNA pseudouridine38-40 synthase